jgi:hypothetical protein
MHKKYFIIVSAILILCNLNAQEKKTSFNGYLSGMPQYSWTDAFIDTTSYYEQTSQYLLHNRMNFYWYPNDKFTGSIQFRNQLMYGDNSKDGFFENGFFTENYFLPLTFQQTFSDAGLLSISIDRAWLQYTHKNLEVKIGRQRINWGQTFVWNPNDIFNTYNFFDFDYAERPGVDAARVLFYPNFTSTIDIAVKIDSGSNVTAAGLYRFNKSGADYQIIGGYYSQPSAKATNQSDNESDWMGGFGITGDFNGISLRTEATYMYPTIESLSQNDLFLWSIGIDYSFKNELSISSELFYSSKIDLGSVTSMNDLNSSPLTVKNLAFAQYNAFAQGSYPITPLFKVTLSGMAFIDSTMKGFFIGPYLDYSIIDNLDLSLYFQFFKFKYTSLGNELKNQTSLAFLRLKWSF